MLAPSPCASTSSSAWSSSDISDAADGRGIRSASASSRSSTLPAHPFGLPYTSTRSKLPIASSSISSMGPLGSHPNGSHPESPIRGTARCHSTHARLRRRQTTRFPAGTRARARCRVAKNHTESLKIPKTPGVKTLQSTPFLVFCNSFSAYVNSVSCKLGFGKQWAVRLLSRLPIYPCTLRYISSQPPSKCGLLPSNGRAARAVPGALDLQTPSQKLVKNISLP